MPDASLPRHGQIMPSFGSTVEHQTYGLHHEEIPRGYRAVITYGVRAAIGLAGQRHFFFGIRQRTC
jgi:hypothetical protein